MTRILCFGDSITFGFTDTAGGWTQRLHNDLAKIYIGPESNPNHEVFNLGISADTAPDILGRIKSESKSRIRSDAVIIIAVGVNDSLYYRDTSDVAFEVDEFGKSMQKIVQAAQAISDKCVVLGLFPCDEAKMQPMPWAKKGESLSNQRLGTFNAEIKHVCEELEVAFIDIFDDLLKLKYKMYLHDGLHPNSFGHQYIADRMNEEVARLANNYENIESGKK